jgi:hypothetical protein
MYALPLNFADDVAHCFKQLFWVFFSLSASCKATMFRKYVLRLSSGEQDMKITCIVLLDIASIHG